MRQVSRATPIFRDEHTEVPWGERSCAEPPRSREGGQGGESSCDVRNPKSPDGCPEQSQPPSLSPSLSAARCRIEREPPEAAQDGDTVPPSQPSMGSLPWEPSKAPKALKRQHSRHVCGLAQCWALPFKVLVGTINKLQLYPLNQDVCSQPETNGWHGPALFYCTHPPNLNLLRTES